MGTVAIAVAHLRKTYGDVVAVEDLTLTVPQGSLFGFLGPNGAGKTTTIGCLTGLLDPTSGNIFLLGRPMHADALDLKRRIGVLPQSLALFDGLYAHESWRFRPGCSASTSRRRVIEWPSCSKRSISQERGASRWLTSVRDN